MNPLKRKKIRQKRYLFPIALLILLGIARLSMPYVLKKYVNNVLAELPGYYGQVADIDISLIRGAYAIDGLYLNKINAGSEVPFLNFEKTDISIEWKSLLKGKIVSEIIMTKPEIIYVFEDQKANTPAEPDVDDWTKALTDLVPVDINKLQINNGKVAFVQLSANPDIDLQLMEISLNATNLSNVVRKKEGLPSTLHATATSIGHGDVTLDGKMDLVKKIPDVDVSFSLENAEVTSLNDFANHYAGIDFESGSFAVYSEIAIADGYLKGYIKPILNQAKLIGKEDGFLDTLWEGFVGFFKFALKNHKNDTLATKVPLEGDLNSVETKIWSTVTNIFKNAWIKAFQNMTDDNIDFEDAKTGADNQNKK